MGRRMGSCLVYRPYTHSAMGVFSVGAIATKIEGTKQNSHCRKPGEYHLPLVSQKTGNISLTTGEDGDDGVQSTGCENRGIGMEFDTAHRANALAEESIMVFDVV